MYIHICIFHTYYATHYALQNTLDSNNATNDLNSLSAGKLGAMQSINGGGALFATDSNVLGLENRFTNNWALSLTFGGAIYAQSSSLELSSNEFSSNIAVSGGAIHSQMGSDVGIDGCWWDDVWGMNI